MTTLAETKLATRKVHFADRIGIKEHTIEIGDNPACSSGPPIQLGWKVESTTDRNFEFYEFFRAPERLRGKQLKIPAKERETMLVETLGYTHSECFQMEQQIKLDRRHRFESLRDAEWDQLSILLLLRGRGGGAGGPPQPAYNGQSHPRRASTDDDILSRPSLDRQRQFRSFVSFGRDRGIDHTLPSSTTVGETTTSSTDYEMETNASCRQSIPKQRHFRSFVSFGGGNMSSCNKNENENENDSPPYLEQRRRRRSFVTLRENQNDVLSPGKVGKGFLKSTGEFMKNITQLGPPFTKNARMA